MKYKQMNHIYLKFRADRAVNLIEIKGVLRDKMGLNQLTVNGQAS